MLFIRISTKNEDSKRKEYKSIRELRKKEPQTKMPRIVVIIDEFQMMFGDDIQTGEKDCRNIRKIGKTFPGSGDSFYFGIADTWRKSCFGTEKGCNFRTGSN